MTQKSMLYLKNDEIGNYDIDSGEFKLLVNGTATEVGTESPQMLDPGGKRQLHNMVNRQLFCLLAPIQNYRLSLPNYALLSPLSPLSFKVSRNLLDSTLSHYGICCYRNDLRLLFPQGPEHNSKKYFSAS